MMKYLHLKIKLIITKKKILNQIKVIDLTKGKIDKYINELSRVSIKILDPNTKKTNTYHFSNNSSNFIYYYCSKRPKCNGKGKIDIKGKKFIIYQNCNNDIEHKGLDYQDFKILYINKNFDKIDFLKTLYQEYYVKATFECNENYDIPTIYKKFKEDTKIEFKITKNKISKIKNKIFGTLKI